MHIMTTQTICFNCCAGAKSQILVFLLVSTDTKGSSCLISSSAMSKLYPESYLCRGWLTLYFDIIMRYLVGSLAGPWSNCSPSVGIRSLRLTTLWILPTKLPGVFFLQI